MAGNVCRTASAWTMTSLAGRITERIPVTDEPKE